MSQKSAAEEAFARILPLIDVPDAEREYEFHPTRKWRLDFAWPKFMFAVEIEGVTHTGGRHQRVAGFLKDAEKYEAALALGWTVYRVPAPWVWGRKRIQLRPEMVAILKSKMRR